MEVGEVFRGILLFLVWLGNTALWRVEDETLCLGLVML